MGPAKVITILKKLPRAWLKAARQNSRALRGAWFWTTIAGIVLGTQIGVFILYLAGFLEWWEAIAAGGVMGVGSASAFGLVTSIGRAYDEFLQEKQSKASK